MERYIRTLGLFILSICCGLFVINMLPGCDFLFETVDPCPYDPDPNCGQDTGYNQAYGNSNSSTPSATAVASSFQFPLLNYPINDGCLAWHGTNPSFPGTYHVADDACAFAGTDVYAVANGIVMYANSYTPCPNWGYLIVIEHVLSDGSVVNSIYGHIAPVIGIYAGVEVSKGQYIGDIVSMSCWSDHIHFGIYDGPFSDIQCNGPGNCNTAGYIATSSFPAGYLDPVQFIEDHQIDCTDYSSEINAVKAEYGSFIGSPTNQPHLYYQLGESSANVCIRDYDATGSSYGTSAIIYDYDGEARQAYLVRSGFWELYSGPCGGPGGNCNQNGVVDCGAPINDEYTQGNGTARQDFQTCYLYWNGSSSTVNPYPYNAPGWTNNGWNATYSYAFAEAYERNGARNDMGETTDVVDGANVHRWGNNSNLPLVQDFDDGSFGWCVLMYNESKNEAYAIHTGFWDYYNNAGPGTHGAPCNDEYSVWGGARQDFENTTLKWNGSSVSAGPNNGCSSSSPSGNSGLDWDWDGWTTEQGDCNDASNGVHPGHPEIYDGVDNDCDGQIDEGLSDPADTDGDGQTPAEGDCNDSNASVYYGAPEICGNGIDNDCVGGDVPCSELYCADNADNDLDGLVDCNDPDCASNSVCAPPPPDHDLDNDGQDAVAYGGQDCNDSNASVYYGAPEICGNGIDNDCVGGDVPCSELYCFDTIDNDLDGLVDCDDPNCNAAIVCQPPPPDYDNDNDGQDGVAFGGQDCNDSNPNVYYGAFEICGNGVDDNCIGGDVPCSELYCADNADNDFDGYVDCNDPDCTSNSACAAPSPADYDGDGSPDSVDCGWWSANIYPGAPELADWLDNDCDGTPDDGCTWGCNGSYWNNCHDDFETYYTTGSLTFVCTGVYIPRITDTDGDGYEDSVDCAYWDPTTYPGAPERSDWNDNDCDGDEDEGCNDVCMGNYAGGCHDDYEWYYLSSAPSAPIRGP